MVDVHYNHPGVDFHEHHSLPNNFNHPFPNYHDHADHVDRSAVDHNV